MLHVHQNNEFHRVVFPCFRTRSQPYFNLSEMDFLVIFEKEFGSFWQRLLNLPIIKDLIDEIQDLENSLPICSGFPQVMVQVWLLFENLTRECGYIIFRTPYAQAPAWPEHIAKGACRFRPAPLPVSRDTSVATRVAVEQQRDTYYWVLRAVVVAAVTKFNIAGCSSIRGARQCGPSFSMSPTKERGSIAILSRLSDDGAFTRGQTTTRLV